VVGREGSIEVLSLTHGLHMPSDGHSGKLMGTRVHRPLTIEKEIDRSSPYLYRAVATGLPLQQAMLRWYRVNEAGNEVEYFNMTMKNVKVVAVSPVVPNIKTRLSEATNHNETVDLRYEEITWTYLDGNISFRDAWNGF